MHLFKTFTLTALISAAVFTLIMKYIFGETCFRLVLTGLMSGIGAGSALLISTQKKQAKNQ
ncbi:hypothetical protein [Mucilaginibacter xinganensis]|uniref:Uncharacterized protein n=1 Tax=Mucilaginibacter xinganensis TaxID=1234841 RepID=A0A223NSS3_9SPHI|nr:hypothetical protein [Mucilaginibacter xinganensis]ASU32949.1 hypothetical protein MuYL_1049 [Mucilaginibacter xinganensis]